MRGFAGQASFTQHGFRTYWLLVVCRVLKHLLHFVKGHRCSRDPSSRGLGLTAYHGSWAIGTDQT